MTLEKSTYFTIALTLAACGGEPTPKTKTPVAPQTEPVSACIEKANPGAEVPGDAPKRITVKHIVVKHADASNADAIDRDRAAACARAEEALDKLKAGEEFATVVATYSDEAGAATREGTLGEVKVEDVAPSFAAAAFALDIGQISYIVESKFGFHIIMRTD